MNALYWLAAVTASTPVAPPLSLEVVGTCVDAAELRQSLLVERSAGKTLPLVARLVCHAEGIDVELSNSHAAAAFRQPLDFGAQENRERGLALVIAEQELQLQPNEESLAPSQTEELEPRPPLQPVPAYDPEDFVWDGEEKPAFPRDLGVFAGPLVRTYASRARVFGAAFRADIKHWQFGAEVAVAEEGGHSARDVGGTLGYLFFKASPQMFSANLGLRARLGYQSYDELHTVYAGGSAFMTLEVEAASGFRARLVPEVGRGGFATRDEFALTQAFYFACALEMGAASLATDATRRR